MVSVGSVSVDVVPSARGWIEKLRAQILPDVDRLGIEIGRTLSARINESLGNAHVTVDVDSALADAQLLATDELANRLDGRKVSLDVGASGSGPGAFTGIASALSNSITSMSTLIPLVAVLGTALIPVVATAAGLAAALVLPLAAAGGGLTLFGLLAGKAASNTNKVGKQIDDLRKKAATLTDPKASAAALAQAKALEESLTGPQRAFLSAKDALSKAFSGLLGGKTGDALFAPLVSGMRLLANILPALSPVIVSVSKAITGLLDSLTKSATGAGFKSFIAGFAAFAGATITSAAKSLALFGQGLFNIFRDFLPLSASVGGGLQALAQKFVDFSNKASTQRGIQNFIAYVKVEGPKVLAALGQITVAIIRVGIALAPIGAKVLDIITAFARLINKVPTGLGTAVLSPILGFGKAIKSMASTVKTAISGMASAVSTSFGRIKTAGGAAVTYVRSLPGKIKSAFDNLPGQLYKAGAYAIQGFINGLKSRAKDVLATAKSIISSIPGTAWSLLKLGSPSRLFHQIGRWTLEGFINGIEAKRKATTEAMAEVIRDIATTFKNHDISKNMRDQMTKVVASVKDGLAKVKSLTADMQAYSAEAGGKFLNDLFNKGTDTTTGLQGLRDQLTLDTSAATQMTAAIKTAVGKGLSGGLLKAVAVSGDVQTAQEIAGLSKSGIAELEKNFNARDKAATALGNFAGALVFDPKISALLAKYDHTLDKLDQKLYDATFKGTRDGLKSGASSGQHASKNRPK